MVARRATRSTTIEAVLQLDSPNNPERQDEEERWIDPDHSQSSPHGGKTAMLLRASRNASTDGVARLQQDDHDIEVNQQDDELQNGKMGRGSKAQNQSDLGNGRTEQSGCQDPPHPDLDVGGRFAVQGQQP
jgi:hypothetical protein